MNRGQENYWILLGFRIEKVAGAVAGGGWHGFDEQELAAAGRRGWLESSRPEAPGRIGRERGARFALRLQRSRRYSARMAAGPFALQPPMPEQTS